jgi:anaerobic ribonucleoside-triphosphate reductase activating protein
MSDFKETIRLAAIVPESFVDGTGIRFSIYVQGCPHRCKGCHNPQTHDFNGGTDHSIDSLIAQIKSNPLLDGVTFSGGEPFCHAAKLVKIARAVKAMGLTVWCYSGYTLAELQGFSSTDSAIRELLSVSDILIDGRFVEEERDYRLKFRGSGNQRMIVLKG